MISPSLTATVRSRFLFQAGTYGQAVTSPYLIRRPVPEKWIEGPVPVYICAIVLLVAFLHGADQPGRLVPIFPGCHLHHYDTHALSHHLPWKNLSGPTASGIAIYIFL